MHLPRSLFLATTLLLTTLASSAAAQCIGGGSGGPIPAIGSGDTTWPATLPTWPLTSTLSVIVPQGATVLKSVRLIGLSHTWAGDVQFVLEDPTGNRHNILCGMAANSSGDFGGDYEIVDPISGAPAFAYAIGSAVTPSGVYSQSFGTFVSGAHGISNTPIEQIPVTSGNWTLYAYDWFNGYFGALTSWELCFGQPSTPTAPTLLAPANNGAAAPPISFTWSSVLGATSYDIDIDGVVTSGVSSPHVASFLGTGSHTWTVRGVNAAGAGLWAPTNSFTALPSCIAGGAPAASFPSPGASSGSWPVTLPTGGISSSAVITPPPGATLAGVSLIGLQHAWSTDVMVVLEDPTGANHLILQRDNGSNCGGCGDDFQGTYTFTSDPLANPLPACSGFMIAPGTYQQDVGAWPSGAAGILTTPVASIPPIAGTWTLKLYDWCVAFDGGSLSSWELCFALPAGPTSYCSSGTTTNGCTAEISVNANPSVTGATPCTVSVSDVEGNKSGLIFYSLSGRHAGVWNASSFLCVKSPTQRTGTQVSSGSTGLCDGTLALDWNAYQSSHPTALGQPFAAGDRVQLQAWFRDPPAGKSTNLSNAIELTYVP